jgi:hypothetical protein
MALRPIKGEPGKFLDTVSGEVLDISDYREDDKYDTVIIPAGAIQPNAIFRFFSEAIGQKRLIDTNIKQIRQLSAGEEMIVDRVGVSIGLAVGNLLPTPSDVKKIAENAFVRFTVNTITLAEGPVLKFPSGYGLAGQTQETDQGVLSIGVASTASAAKLLKTQLLTSQHQFEGEMQFYDRDWMAAAIPLAADRLPVFEVPTPVKAYWHGLLKTASTRN